jgi:hypothetical protein
MDHFEYKHICLKDIVVSGESSRDEKESAFSLLIEEWEHRDGAAGYSLSDNFLEILEAEPYLFFSRMKERRQAYDTWLSHLGVFSFVWFGDPPSPLEKKRQDIIKYLGSLSNLGEDVEPLRDELIEVLKEIEPRVVD